MSTSTTLSSSTRSSTASNSRRSLNSIRSSITASTSSLPDDRAPEWNLNQIYGRENESKIIQNHIDKLSTGTIVVKGLSGSGKSSLIRSQNFEEDGWVFATGKYEVRRKQEPYSALIDALDSIVNQWIANNKNASICRMGSFNLLLDEDLDLLKNVLPKTFNVVKAFQERAEKCPQFSSEFRSEPKSETKSEASCDSGAINAAFWRILSFLCEAKPVVLFLDDLQWADQASLDAIRVLASAGNIEGFALILSYRDEEVKEGDTVFKCLDFIKKEGERVETIHVTDLDVEQTNKMVSSILEQEPERTLELTKVIHGKTAGNPFFVIQFIQMLRHESFLKYNFMILEWEWGDINKMDQLASVSDNVADVIAASMSKLPQSCLLAIQNASCLGKVIPMQVIIEFFRKCGAEKGTVCQSLVGIQKKGLRQIFQDAVKFGILAQIDENTFMWTHDKLQHVAYSMIPARYLQDCHRGLGMILWEMHKSNPENEWMLYLAADQLNRVSDVTDDGLRIDIARLSFEAGQLSISKAAFFPALDMLRFAAKHLANMKDSWETAYELSLDVYSTLAQISMRFLSYEEALDAAILVEEHAKSLEDKIRAQVVIIRHKVEGSNRDYQGGVTSVRKILLDYGVKLPTKYIPGQEFIESKKLMARLEGRVETFLTVRKLDEKKIDDIRTINILKLLTLFLEYTFNMENNIQKRKGLNTLVTVRVLNMCLKEGISSDVALAIANYGGLRGQQGCSEDAAKWSDVAIKLVESFPRKLGSRHSQVHTWVTYGFSKGQPFHKMLEPILELNRLSLRHGDIGAGCMAWVGYFYAYTSVGLPLDPLDSDLMSFSKEARPLGVAPTIKVLFPIFRQVINNLKEFHPNPTLLKGDIFDQENELKKFTGGGLKMTLRDINSLRLMLACIYQEWTTAEELIISLEPFLYADRWYIRRHLYLTYMGYASLILGKNRNGKKGKKFQKLGKKIIKIYQDFLKIGSPDALPVIGMLEAIESPSKKRFDEAIRTTARLGMVHYEAILYENAGHFFMDNGSTSWAEYYLSEAAKLYGEWGANGKTKTMLDKYEFLRPSSLNDNLNGGNIHGRTQFSIEPMIQFREPITSIMASKRSSYDEKEEKI